MENKTNKKGSPVFKKGSKGKDYGQSKIQGDMDKAFAEFKEIDTSTNLFEDVENKLEGLKSDFTNSYEDLQVSTTAADFQKKALDQNYADILGQFKGGGGNVSSLAQTLSNQQSLKYGEISGGLAQQEQQLQMQRAKGDQFVQQAEYQSELAVGTMGMEAQKIKLQGKADARDLTLQAKQGELSFLSGLMQSANANEDADFRKGENFWSDRRLKKNINLIGESLSGLNIYSFEYKDSIYGDGLFQGVMSDEIPQSAVYSNGEYDMVDYSVLDVEFKHI